MQRSHANWYAVAVPNMNRPVNRLRIFATTVNDVQSLQFRYPYGLARRHRHSLAYSVVYTLQPNPLRTLQLRTCTVWQYWPVSFSSSCVPALLPASFRPANKSESKESGRSALSREQYFQRRQPPLWREQYFQIFEYSARFSKQFIRLSCSATSSPMCASLISVAGFACNYAYTQLYVYLFPKYDIIAM